MARLVFMGTPQAAVPTLTTIAQAHDVALVVTQPDRPRGRSKRLVAPPVKEAALEHDLVVAQPEDHHGLETAINEAGPFDLGVVVAYGRILRPEILRLPEHGLVNVHFSLLPRWRGAAPVARALMAGDPMTGITIMKVDEGLDTGPVLTAQAIDIGPTENADQLTGRLAILGARLLAGSIKPYLSGDLVPERQVDEGATYADKIEAADRPINPADSLEEVLNQVRALSPVPAATLGIDGKPHKLLRARASKRRPPQGTWQILEGSPVVGLSDGGMEILALQPPGKRVVEGVEWARGRRDDGGVLT
ncbi:MAG: methionyl-tRNA formyltransferase [Acidimicrobiia bacterium]